MSGTVRKGGCTPLGPKLLHINVIVSNFSDSELILTLHNWFEAFPTLENWLRINYVRILAAIVFLLPWHGNLKHR